MNMSKEGFSYNFYIHPKESWYIRIIPRFVHRAGFELGTGLSVNVVDPVEAARALREIKKK
jgi:galactose-1-phosphate uridylyltransferase